MHHFFDLRKNDQLTSGRISSHFTTPEVTRSMSGQYLIGIFSFHWLTFCFVVFNAFASAALEPTILTILSIIPVLTTNLIKNIFTINILFIYL